MKSEAFFAALPVRAVPTADETVENRPKSWAILLIVIPALAGIVGLGWGRLSAARLQFQSEDALVQTELALQHEKRQAVFDLRISPEADYLCFRSSSGALYRVNLTTPDTEHNSTILFEGQFCEELQISPVTNQIAASFLDGSVQLQSLESLEASPVILEKNGGVMDYLVFSPDGRLLAGSSTTGAVFIWDVETATRITEFRRVNDRASGLVFDSNLGLLVSFDSGIERWLLDPAEQSVDRHVLDWSIPQHYSVREMVVSPDGRYLVTSSFFGDFNAWDLTKREQLWQRKIKTQLVRGLLFSKDSKSILCFSGEKELMEHDLLSGEELSSYYDPQMGLGTGVACSPEGDLIYSGSSDGFIRIWTRVGNLLLGKLDTGVL